MSDNSFYVYPELREQAKRNVYAKYPKHSAYRSLMIGKEYRRLAKERYHTTENLYRTDKRSQKANNLRRWVREEWTNQHGGTGYTDKDHLYRPRKHVSSKTPVTWSELKPSQIKRAKIQKESTGHVKRFRTKPSDAADSRGKKR